ncbi:MAG: ferrous iron transport protein B [bacterium]|nr:ferrous iron transport protein B [bacterium]
MTKSITIAVAGNPNVGKSTLINAIAGSKLKSGNWSGVTVEKKEVILTVSNFELHFIDLPGSYSLKPYSLEEEITAKFLSETPPDVILHVVDSTNFERGLYFTTLLIDLNIPIVMALNMTDELERDGKGISAPAIKSALNIIATPTAANRNRGVKEVLQTIIAYGINPGKFKPVLPADLADIISAANTEDGEIEARFNWAKRTSKDWVTTLTDVAARVPLTDKLDQLFLHKWFGFPIFLGIMWLVFKLTFDVSAPFIDWIDGVFSGPFSRWASALVSAVHAPDWVSSLVVEGVFAGAGFVMVFVPVIFAMTFFLTVLEGTGYMARVAFLMDRLMRPMGLNGKSFIPMLLGFGCNVPSIYATRTLDNMRDRILTSLVIPLMSCGARLPVYVVFAGAFFAQSAGTVIFFLYMLGIVMALLVGVAFKKTLFKSDSSFFIIELPPYRLPTLSNLWTQTWAKGRHFIKRAGTYIVGVSIIVWFLLNMPWGVIDKQDSYLGKLGSSVAPVFEPIGFGTWQAASSLITGVIAKEIIISTMGEVYAVDIASSVDTKTVYFQEQTGIRLLASEVYQIGVGFLTACKDAVFNTIATFSMSTISLESDESTNSLRSALQTQFGPASALSFMVFVLLYMPCVVTGIAMKQEFGTWKWFGVATAYGVTLAWIASFITYRLALLFGG